jgi:MFS family permease
MVLAEFLAMGLPLPVLPSHVHEALGVSALVVGLVIGAQSWATLLTRPAAGARSDRRGPRSTAALGLTISFVAGLVQASSTVLLGTSPMASLGVLLVGRALLGLGESFVITAALSWGVSLVGRERSGLVMAWIGIAMYGALALGAPLGAALAPRIGFVGVALLATAMPLLGVLAARTTRDVAPVGGTRLSMLRVAATVALPASGLALAALGFGAILAYSALRFEARGWQHAELATTSFGAAYVLARVLLGHLPDRLGGARVAMGSSALVVVGQLATWLAPTPTLCIAAAAFTGFGFSLAFPSFGIEAVRRVPPQSRGAALGAYAASFDLAMGVGVPLLGALVEPLGHDAVVLAGAAGALVSFAIALRLHRAAASTR